MLSRLQPYVVGIVVALLVRPVFAQDPSPTLVKKTVTIQAQTASLSEYLLTVFRGANIRGGISVVSEHCPEAAEEMPEFSGEVEGVLKRLVSTGHPLQWFQMGDNLIVLNTPSPPPILTVEVREFRFSRKEPLTKSASGLFDTPEVAATVRDLGLVEYGPELGFAALHQPGTPANMVVLRNTKVLDALNGIGGGDAVWLYKESKCQRNVFSLNWPIRR